MRFWFGRASSFLDAEDEVWQDETWRWFLARFGGVAALCATPLVTPTSAFFPPTDATGHDRALHIFQQVQRHAGMSEWPCTLVAQQRRPESRLSEFTFVKGGGEGPAGTFRIESGQAIVTYDPGALDDPASLVATLAHELCHYRLAAIGEAPPGGAEAHEYATDLATVHLGFGLFGAMSAFAFRQHGDAFSQGWQWRRQGYLDRRSWCYALAMFFALRGESVDAAKPFLAPALFSDLRSAASYLRRHRETVPAA
jgi:hypothetical protein